MPVEWKRVNVPLVAKQLLFVICFSLIIYKCEKTFKNRFYEDNLHCNVLRIMLLFVFYSEISGYNADFEHVIYGVQEAIEFRKGGGMCHKQYICKPME